MELTIFKSYKNGYFTFLFENGEDMVFDEAHPRVLKQYNLKDDKTLINRTFRISFVEVYDDSDDDSVIYRIESLKPI
jgi:hypothetical protein